MLRPYTAAQAERPSIQEADPSTTNTTREGTTHGTIITATFDRRRGRLSSPSNETIDQPTGDGRTSRRPNGRQEELSECGFVFFKNPTIIGEWGLCFDGEITRHRSPLLAAAMVQQGMCLIAVGNSISNVGTHIFNCSIVGNRCTPKQVDWDSFDALLSYKFNTTDVD